MGYRFTTKEKQNAITFIDEEEKENELNYFSLNQSVSKKLNNVVSNKRDYIWSLFLRVKERCSLYQKKKKTNDYLDDDDEEE